MSPFGYSLMWKPQNAGLVDGSQLRADRLCGLTLSDVRGTRLPVGNRSVPVGELFEVTPNERQPARLVVEGSPRIERLAAGMESGLVEVHGDTGALLALGLRGGTVRVRGHAGGLAGAAMAGGTLIVEGDAGDRLGGPPPGTARGMAGGEIVVLGRSGAETGLGMRRGLIAVADGVGASPGYAALAGTIVVARGGAEYAGASMRRATVLFLDALAPRSLAPGFVLAARQNLTVVRLLLRRLELHGFPIPAGAPDSEYEIWNGPELDGARGELLYRTV